MDSTRPVDQSWASQSTDLYEFKVCSSRYCVHDGMFVHSMEFSRRVGYTYLQNVVLSCSEIILYTEQGMVSKQVLELTLWLHLHSVVCVSVWACQLCRGGDTQALYCLNVQSAAPDKASCSEVCGVRTCYDNKCEAAERVFRLIACIPCSALPEYITLYGLSIFICSPAWGGMTPCNPVSCKSIECHFNSSHLPG